MAKFPTLLRYRGVEEVRRLDKMKRSYTSVLLSNSFIVFRRIRIHSHASTAFISLIHKFVARRAVEVKMRVRTNVYGGLPNEFGCLSYDEFKWTESSRRYFALLILAAENVAGSRPQMSNPRVV